MEYYRPPELKDYYRGPLDLKDNYKPLPTRVRKDKEVSRSRKANPFIKVKKFVPKDLVNR